MRVVFLMPSYVWGPSGGIRVVYEYANRLAAKGHEVSVVHPRRLKHDRPMVEVESLYYKLRRRAFAAIEVLYKPPIRWQAIDPRVRQLYVPNSDSQYIPDADAVFATAYRTVPSVLEYPSEKGEKCYLLQGYETFMGPKHLVDETWLAPMHKVAVSTWLMEIGKGLGCTNITYIPNAIDHDRYRLLRPIEGRPNRISMVFSKGLIKGSADAVAALEIVRAKHPSISAILFGLPRYRPSIPKWIEYHSNPSQDFIIENIYNRSSIFVSPSWSEGYALPPAEAAACGCSIVAADSGGIREYVENGVTGMLSQPKSPIALAENISFLLTNEDVRVKLALAANQRVRKLSWDRSTERLESFIRNVMEQREVVSE